MKTRVRSGSPKQAPILVTGGCGFIGCNIADALARRGEKVRVLDGFVRDGARENAMWLQSRNRDRVAIITGDVRNAEAVSAAVDGVKGVLHLAGQVAVTSSLDDPLYDFDVNARGSLNVLEALRRHNPDAGLVFASTNKVYGRLLEDVDIVRRDARYAPADTRLEKGVDERQPLDLYSPYGCSKGAADQYVRDYARVFGLRTVVMRMSCIYGPRQFGTEDQGWIAHMFLRAIRGEPITIYGDGYQVRDALHIDDAVAAWIGALDHIEDVAGSIFNLGGGPGNTISLRELLGKIETLMGAAPETRHEAWRPGDQPWYVSDTRRLETALQWRPRTAFDEGLLSLERWLVQRFGELAAVAGARA
jgi:CDP-paratose 2-epimerase